VHAPTLAGIHMAHHHTDSFRLIHNQDGKPSPISIGCDKNATG